MAFTFARTVPTIKDKRHCGNAIVTTSACIRIPMCGWIPSRDDSFMPFSMINGNSNAPDCMQKINGWA
eukprot:scaffold284_cov172-Amphora_coffeaeformis.AAC.3